MITRTRELARHPKAEPVDIVAALGPYWNIIAYRCRTKYARETAESGDWRHGLANRTLPTDRNHVREIGGSRGLVSICRPFVAVSHAVGAEAIAEYRPSADRVVVIPNPALARVRDRVMATPAARADPGHLDLCFPARLVPEKRPLIAVEVAAIPRRL